MRVCPPMLLKFKNESNNLIALLEHQQWNLNAQRYMRLCTVCGYIQMNDARLNFLMKK